MSENYEKKTYAEILEEASSVVLPNLSPGEKYADDKRLFQGIPGIECTARGRLWATWYSGGQGESPLNYVMLVTSGDYGESWSKPVLVIDPPGKVRACDHNLWLAPDGKLWLTWMQSHTLHDGRWGVWKMTTDNPDDEHPAWTSPERISDGVMLNKPTVLKDGEWLFSISLLDSHPISNERRMLPMFLRTGFMDLISEEELAEIDSRAGAYVFSSIDNGKTLTPKGRAIAPSEVSTHNEHMVVERKDGSLWMLLRTSYGLAESVSNDKGKTWFQVTPSNIPHTPSRFFLRRLKSGNLLLVKNGSMVDDRTDKSVKLPRNNMTAFISEDEGKSWKGSLLLDERATTYPDGAQGEDGTIYVIYDMGRRKEKEIVMSRITEEDILAGKLVSGRSRLRVLINKATGVIPEKENWSNFKGKDDPEGELIFTGI
ncbi:MAG: sialidase family protein [Planctomycetota bacterium]|jgi:hypothetical protein